MEQIQERGKTVLWSLRLLSANLFSAFARYLTSTNLLSVITNCTNHGSIQLGKRGYESIGESHREDTPRAKLCTRKVS